MKDLEKKIKSFHNNLSPKLKLASVSILQELNQIPFQTIRDTAKKANVSVLTILRLSKIWGFKGYSDFQSDVKKKYYTQKNNSSDFNLTQKENIKFEKSILAAATILLESESIYIAGFRSAKSFASYMNYMGGMVFDNFYLMPDSGLSAAQDLARLKKKTLLVALSTTPYSTETVKLGRTAKSLNIKTLSFTDSSISPLSKHSDYLIEVPINKQNKLFNMAPMITVIEQVLEKSYEILGDEADYKIKYFSERVKSINGYW